MVSNKKIPANIRTPAVHSPVLVSPISVAHQNKMLENDGVNKSGTNWMRDQWVANLKKKSLANAPGLGTGPAGLSHSAMFFNDLGCFEIESQSFTCLTPSARDFDFLLPSPLNGSLSMGTTSSSADATPASVTNSLSKTASSTASTANGSSSTSDSTATKSKGSRAKPLLKKRTNVLALEVNQPKPRTPRRKLNCGNAFEDIDTQSPRASSVGATAQFYSSVGTPSNFSAEVSRMWGQDIDFADTFLDLPTPKSAEMPMVHPLSATPSAQSQQHARSGSSGASNSKGTLHLDGDLGQPKLIRTTSIEQEGLSHFFEMATLNSNECSPSSSPSQQHYYGDNGHRHPPAHHRQIKKNQIDLSGPYTQAAIGVVDECFSKLMPSPHAPHSRRNSLLLSSSAPSGSSQFLDGNSSGSGPNRPMSATPRGTLRTPRGTEPTFDHKNMPEFETLLDEYKFTDMDQELDSFYLDTIESFGCDLDLISN